MSERAKERKPSSRWIEGSVDERSEHFALFHKEDSEPAALLGKGGGRTFVVQFEPRWRELDEGAKDEVKWELNYYLIELGDPDAWGYAIYHCGTASNAYSAVHWAYCPNGH